MSSSRSSESTTNTTTIMTTPDGDVTIATTSSPTAFDIASFLGGMIVGALAYWLVAWWRRLRRHRADPAIAAAAADPLHGELSALRQRTATLEKIVTDPVVRLDREIETLR